MRAKVRLNTPAEEREIQRGIARDRDNPEQPEDFFAKARLATEALPAETVAELRKRQRGPGRRAAKAQVTLRLDPDVLEALRASGPGWQTRANAALRKLAMR